MISWKILNGFVTDMSRKNDLGLTGWAELGKGLGRALKGLFEKIDFDTIADTFVKGFNGIFEVLKNFNAEKPFEGLGKKISDGLNKIIRGIDPGEAGKAISDFVTGVLGVFVDVAEQTDWEMFGKMCIRDRYQTAEDKQIEYEKEKQATLELAKLTKEGVGGSGNKV